MSKGPKQRFGATLKFRLPEKQVKQIVKLAEDRGTTVAQLLREAVAKEVGAGKGKV